MTTRARITIDGDLAVDGSLGNWQQHPPEAFRGMLHPGARPQPGMQALLVAVADAARSRSDITATLTNRPGGYDLAVDFEYRRRGPRR